MHPTRKPVKIVKREQRENPTLIEPGRFPKTEQQLNRELTQVITSWITEQRQSKKRSGKRAADGLFTDDHENPTAYSNTV